MTDKSADSTVENADYEKQISNVNAESEDIVCDTAGTVDEYPPLPDYPPEEVNPVEAALNSFIEEANGEQETIRQREEQFVNDVSAPVSEPVDSSCRENNR